MKNFITALLLSSTLLSSCTVSKNVVIENKDTLPFDLEVLKNSRETILTQTLPWEKQMMGYFKVLKIAQNNWKMWYSSWDNNRKDDYSGYLVYAHSKDGKNWAKTISGKENNILRGSGHPKKDGIVEQDVILEPMAAYPYKMIYTAKDASERDQEKTFIEESKDGIQWVNRRVLWNQKHDSQFAVIQRDSLYYIYLRHWEIKNNVRYRTIGLAITDNNWNTIEEPHNLLKADFEGDYPHLYNPGTSKVSEDLDIMFPTFFNEKTNAIKFGLAYVYKGKAFLTNINLNEYMLDDQTGNWGIVSPGLIPAGKNLFWLYYYATNMVHSDYNKGGRLFKYYRIKIRLKEKKV